MANPDWDRFVGEEPEMAEALRPFLRDRLADGALGAAEKELIAVALLAAQGYAAGVRSHAGRALAAGATPAQLREALAMVQIFEGVGRFLRAREWVEAAIVEAAA